MIKEALEYLIALGEPPYRESIDGIEYVDRELVRINPPRADHLEFARLQGFADFVNCDRETNIDRGAALIHVASPWRVQYFSQLSGAQRDREIYAIATVREDRAFTFDNFMSAEEFVIKVQTLIVDLDGTDKGRLIEIAGNIGAEQIRTDTDDGISQIVAVKTGVTMVKRKTVENPFWLAPNRTFAEVKQPISPFILRARQANETTVPMMALFQCDNNAWQIDAVALIREWLASKIDGVPILA